MENGPENACANVCFKMIGDEPAIAWALDNKAERAPFDGIHEDDAGLLLFPNICSPDTAALALEHFPFAPLPPILGATKECLDSNPAMRESFVAVSGVSDPKMLLKSFGLSPTKAKLRDARNALGRWKSEAETFAIIPVKDILMAAHDLKALLSILLHAIDDGNRRHHYCTAEMLGKNIMGGVAFLANEVDGCRCYTEFLRSIRRENEMAFIGLDDFYGWGPEAKEIRRELSEDRQVLGEFAMHSINGFLSALRPRIDGGRIVVSSGDENLSDVYYFWTSKAMDGKAGICEHCGKLFARQRCTAKYCDESCSTMNNR